MKVTSRAQDKELAVNNKLYLGEGDFDTVYALCMERASIGMTCSSTPTGRRSKFYEICTDRNLNFKEHYHPAQHSPLYSPEMEKEFRATFDKNAYVHEVLAEFGIEEAGVFDKEALERATRMDNYVYNDEIKPIHNEFNLRSAKKIHLLPEGQTTYKYNMYRTMAVDWDKSQAPTSILVLDYDAEWNKFRVINRTMIEPSDFHYDLAVKKIINLNAIYNPAHIYIDRGAGK